MHKHQRQHREGIQELLRVVGRGKGLEWSFTNRYAWTDSWKDGQVFDKGIWTQIEKRKKKKAMEWRHLATLYLPPCTADSLGWLVHGGVTVHAVSTVHALVIQKWRKVSGGQWEVKLERCRSRRKKTVLYGSPRHLESILWQSKSLKDYQTR